MKLFKIIMLSIATLLTSSLMSCSDNNKNIGDDPIAVEQLQDEITKALEKSLEDKLTVTDSLSNICITSDSITLQRPTINVNVNMPTNDSPKASETIFCTVVVATVFGIPCLTVLLILIIVLRYVYKHTSARNALIQKAIENNYELPEAFFNSSPKARDERDPQLLQSSIKYIGIGLLLCIMFMVEFNNIFLGMICLIPTIIGIGKIVTYFTSKPSHTSDSSSDTND